MTKEHFLKQLRSQHQNVAIVKHIAKVEAMTDAEFSDHLVKLDDLAKRAAGSITAMVKEVM